MNIYNVKRVICVCREKIEVFKKSASLCGSVCEGDLYSCVSTSVSEFGVKVFCLAKILLLTSSLK